jgi:hypothetical protein
MLTQQRTAAVGIEFGMTLKHEPTSKRELERSAERRGDVSEVLTPVWSFCQTTWRPAAGSYEGSELDKVYGMISLY